jgi:DNA-binding PadR family transcriptional regulator
MVLGIVKRERQAHGYKVYRELVSWQTEKWSKVRPGSIYHALSQLEKEGFLHGAPTTQGSGLARTSYKITSAGKKEFIQLVENALIEYDLELFAAGLAFMHELPRAQVIELAKQRLKAHEDVSAFLGTLPREAVPSTPEKHPEIIGMWTNFFDGSARWQENFIKHIEEGEYSFVGEK